MKNSEESIISSKKPSLTIETDGEFICRDTVGKDPKLIVYGHSMGTGVASHAVAEIHKEGSAVDGVILDSGGNSTDKIIITKITKKYHEKTSQKVIIQNNDISS